MLPVRNPNSISIRPIVTIGLMATCTLVFLWELSLTSQETICAIYHFAVIPTFFLHKVNPVHSPIPVELTLITSMFFHANTLHLAGNLLFLWIFGKTIEDSTGYMRFITFYFLCGIMATMPYILLHPDSQTPIIGASGAISSVLGAYFRLFPRSKIVVFYLRGFYPDFTRISAGWVLIAWYVLQLLLAIFTNLEQKTIAWEIHLSGFTIGMLIIPLFYRSGKLA